MIEASYPDLSLVRQCALMGVSRSGWLLRGEGGERIEPSVDALDRRAVFAHAVVRLAADGAALAASGPRCRPRAGAAADADDRFASRGAAAEHVPPGAGTQGVPVSALQSRCRAPEPCLVCASACPSDWAIAIYNISGIAAKRRDPKWWLRISCDNRTVARQPTWAKTKAGQARKQRSAADLGRRTARWPSVCAGWSTDRRTPGAALERSATRPAYGPSMGESVEP